MSPKSNNPNLFIGSFPTGLVYAGRTKEERGDYKKIAHLSYATLELTVYDRKSKLLPDVRKHAAGVQAQAGQEYPCSVTQTIQLGYGIKVKSLTCCCCGGLAKGRQWWNRDTGYGLCPGCAKWIADRGESPASMKESYGIAGYHYFTEED